MRTREILMTAAAAILIALPYLLIYHKPSAEQFMSAVKHLARRDPVQKLDSVHEEQSNGELANSNGELAGSEDALKVVLASAAMPNKTVIITTLNHAWAANNTMIDLFLESFHRGENIEELLEHLLIVALDQKSYKRCQQLHPHCFMLKTEGVDFSGFKPYMSTDFLKMMWRRMKFMTRVLEMGYSFVFSDADIVWFRNPFHHFDKNADFQISCDRFRGDPLSEENRPNCGYVYSRSNNHTIAMYKHWCEEGGKRPNIDEQTILNGMLRWKVPSKFGVKIRFLETDRFSGLCQKSNDMTKVVTMHANCCTGLDNKMTDLRLAMDDWQAGKSVPPPKQEEGSKPINLWRAPAACRHSIWPQSHRKRGTKPSSAKRTASSPRGV